MHTEHEICEVCGKPVLEGQARHGIRGGHWDCRYPNGVPGEIVASDVEAIKRRSDEAIKKIDKALDMLKKLKYR